MVQINLVLSKFWIIAIYEKLDHNLLLFDLFLMIFRWCKFTVMSVRRSKNIC